MSTPLGNLPAGSPIGTTGLTPTKNQVIMTNTGLLVTLTTSFQEIATTDHSFTVSESVVLMGQAVVPIRFFRSGGNLIDNHAICAVTLDGTVASAEVPFQIFMNSSANDPDFTIPVIIPFLIEAGSGTHALNIVAKDKNAASVSTAQARASGKTDGDSASLGYVMFAT